MIWRTLTMVVALATTTPALASTVTYGCHATDDSAGLYVARLDTVRRTLTWRGTVYRDLKAVSNNTDCAKLCFRNGSVDLNTATDGVATLLVRFGTGPGDDGADVFECDVLRVGKP